MKFPFDVTFNDIR